uniref:Ig heavy chain Mem5-like isoform X2 n=1 Tax=Phascolarctos cinereus TaxID=38626 RepID=A0A6P5KXU8_PHACI|nr:Ig heavy chain Mem5-like isoform X2 [Phascolarctos cinereus]
MDGLPLLTLSPILLHSVEETVLTESGGGPQQAGKTLNLKCQTSGFEFKTSKLGWYLWAPGRAPLWLTSLHSSSTDATEDRITTSREDTGSQIFLKIEGLGLRDSGQYHCARRVGNGDDTDKLVFGRGTDVTVEPAQAPTLVPMANGTYSAVQIGRVGENDTVTCSVKHLGKEIHVSHKPDHTGPDPGIACKQNLMGGPEQGNKLLLSVMGLRLLFVKIVAINVLFTTMALIF